MTIEEKATAYDEAVERARKIHNDTEFDYEKGMVEEIFPELAMSEDERIRKEIKDVFYSLGEGKIPVSINFAAIFDWLEKQGNKPKFKVGDWITNGACTIQITSIDDRYYWHDNDCVGGDIESIDKEYHLWTIDDAKEGDVLIFKDEIFIYKHDIINCTQPKTNFGGFVYHCCYDGKHFVIDSLYSLTEKDKNDIHPATREQCDLLFQKMKEANYVWYPNSKELYKLIRIHYD